MPGLECDTSDLAGEKNWLQNSVARRTDTPVQVWCDEVTDSPNGACSVKIDSVSCFRGTSLWEAVANFYFVCLVE